MSISQPIEGFRYAGSTVSLSGQQGAIAREEDSRQRGGQSTKLTSLLLDLPVSPAAAIDHRHCELRQIDPVDAAHIQRHHIRAVGLLFEGEHLDAAINAVLMPDGMAIEQILFEIVLAGAKLKAPRRHEGEMQPFLGADRAVAIAHNRKIGGAFEAHLAAMAAAGVSLAAGCPRSSLGHIRSSPRPWHEAIPGGWPTISRNAPLHVRNGISEGVSG
jgi:hypothetical protein